jgi:hypothetical protein
MRMRAYLGAWPQRLRIGLGVSGNSIRAIGLRDRAVLWALESPIEPGQPLAPQITALLARVPNARASWKRPRVMAAVGPALVQTKRLSGVPTTTDARLASALVREGARRFFMLGSEPAITSDVVSIDGEPWAAAFDRHLVDAIESACEQAKVVLDGIVPAVTILSGAISGDAISWRDGDDCFDIRYVDGAMRSLKRVPCTGQPKDQADPTLATEQHAVSDLAVLGDDSPRFADAYAAAVLPTARIAFGAPLQRDGAAAAIVSRRRAVLATGLCAAAILAAAIAPGLATERAGRDARNALGSLASARADLRETEKNLGWVTSALDEVARVEARRRSALAFLGHLTTALPEGSAVVALRLDTASGTVVALTSRASSLVSRLDTIPSVVGPEIVGPVTRETVSARDLERVTVRFTLSTAARRP